MVLDLAEEVARRSAPDAWLIDFTNPVGIVTQALLDEGHRAIGLCNVAIGFQRRFARHFGVPPERVAVEQVGLNHLTWIRSVSVDGREVMPEILADPSIAFDTPAFPPELVRALGAIPSYYLRYYYSTAEMLAAEREGPPRAEAVAAIERQLLELYADPTLDRKPELLEKRGGAYYSEAAAALMASLNSGAGDVQVVDVRNDGALPDLPAGWVVELPARIDRSGAHPTGGTGPRDARARRTGQGLRGADNRGRAQRRSDRSRCAPCWQTRWCRASRRPPGSSRRSSPRTPRTCPASGRVGRARAMR